MDIYAIRRENLQTIIDTKFDGQPRNLADKMGKQPSQITRHIPPRGGETRPIGSGMARQIEEAAGMPAGWLDRLHRADVFNIHEDGLSYAATTDPEQMAEEQALDWVDIYQDKLNIRLSAADKRQLFKLMKARFLRELQSGKAIPMNSEEITADVLDFAKFAEMKGR